MCSNKILTNSLALKHKYLFYKFVIMYLKNSYIYLLILIKLLKQKWLVPYTPTTCELFTIPIPKSIK